MVADSELQNISIPKHNNVSKVVFTLLAEFMTIRNGMKMLQVLQKFPSIQPSKQSLTPTPT
jgi:hypothetical protein